uniref:B30.2/SPRY domain-containing protein n=1 Tax=Gasterosteus aculeatus aculeatus TaxID=481459 RepID=A0AAQ4QRT9_GASAC
RHSDGDDLKLDESTASKRLVLSDGGRKAKTVQLVNEKVQRPESPVRFKRTQVFCEKGLNGLCYWEVECEGEVGIAVAYRAVGRRWDRSGGLGCNDKSWSLLCSRYTTRYKTRYTAIHGKTSKDVKPNNGKLSKAVKRNNKRTSEDVNPKENVQRCKKIGVFLDWEAGTLTYYRVKPEKELIHTFHHKFTELVFPCFWFKNGSVTLCEMNLCSVP